ncbi:NADP-dependent oxidoreductase [Acrocarpospora macrocephala]|uniref:Zinc-binding alcohol dehydrogenase n=1 Tax=Acrocarpospora macrocephala TaxID=150177 RepID=A0A5M3WH36_9ACTN|nr:NADP-dependent oxidoreductase [Acrocarpospora macrocephala]GES08437.1 zinc-binding alcohol dehydrogenase [Acrocarpospora macrocephala]
MHSEEQAPAVGLTRFGGPEVLRLVGVPITEPEGAQVRVHVKAATVNPTDVLFRTGRITGRLREDGGPLVPGMDFAGVVSAVGDSATWSVGDRVVGATLPGMEPASGAYSSQVIVQDDSLTTLPAGSDFVSASTLLMNGLTAMRALDDLPPGGVLGVTGGAGAVGGYTIQLAKIRGWTVVADATPGDVSLIESLGADRVVARGDGVGARFMAAAGRPLDAVVDAALVGPEDLMPAVRDSGWFVTVRPDDWQPERAITKFMTVCVAYFHDRAKIDYLRDRVEDGSLTLRVATTFEPSQAAEAHRTLERGRVRGRLVLDWT